MAKFLDTTGISYHLEQLIKSAEERLVIISPFLKINDRIKELLEDKNRLKLDIRVIYGKNELVPEQNNWLRTMDSIRTSYCKNLHAKCYVNEKEALITSMNLYDFSQANNNEMGIYILRSEEENLYADINTEVNRLIRISDEVKVSVERVPRGEKEEKTDHRVSRIESSKSSLPKRGVCIRCGTALKLDPRHPYCKDCFVVWKEYENETFEEKYCHICGKSHNSTLLKPACLDCYRRLKGRLVFPG